MLYASSGPSDNSSIDTFRISSGNRTIITIDFSFTSDFSYNYTCMVFLVENTTQGVHISTTQPYSKDLITKAINNVFLPPTNCSYDSHLLLFNIEMFNETFVQYILGVPANQSMLLLQFRYGTTSPFFEMVSMVEAYQGIVGCSPTSVVQLNKQYYTLCANQVDNNIQVLDDFSQVSFNPKREIRIAPYISLLTYTQTNVVRLMFVNYPILTVVNVKLVEECSRIFSIYYHCITSYSILDITMSSSFDDLNVISSYYYNETGYRVICSNEDGSIVAEIAIIKSDFNRTIHYRGKKFIIPGQAIDLEKSVCFGVEEKLFYLYSDSRLGAFLVNLETGNWTNLPTDSLSAINIPPNLQVFYNRYVLLKGVLSASNETLHLFDLLVQDFVSVPSDQVLQLQKPAEEGTKEQIILLIIFIVVITVVIQ